MHLRTSLVAQRVKCLPSMQETWVWSLGGEDPLEKEMATHSSILAWKTPWMEKPGGLQSMESQRVVHDWVTSLSLYMHLRVFFFFFKEVLYKITSPKQKMLASADSVFIMYQIRLRKLVSHLAPCDHVERGVFMNPFECVIIYWVL